MRLMTRAERGSQSNWQLGLGVVAVLFAGFSIANGVAGTTAWFVGLLGLVLLGMGLLRRD